MALVFNICPCGKAFESKSANRIYCDGCRKTRAKEAQKRASQKYFATEKGKKKQRELARNCYYRNHEKKKKRSLDYYFEHREERAEYLRKKKAAEPKLCKHCKQPFDRQGLERICPSCKEMLEAQRKRFRSARWQEQKQARQLQKLEKASLTTKPKTPRKLKAYHTQIKRLDEKLHVRQDKMLTEAERLEMFRAVLAKCRAA